MKGKNIISKLFSAAFAKGKPEHRDLTSYSPLLQNRIQNRYRHLPASEGVTYRSVTACIH